MAECDQEPGTCSGNPEALGDLNTVPECGDETCTFCDGDLRDNVWIEGGNRETGEGGVCLLNTMTEDQIVYVLQRDEKARADLKRVTTNEYLLRLANEVPRLPTVPEGDELQRTVNRNQDSVMLYSVFRGQPPFAQ
jgi:hypothetical protein